MYYSACHLDWEHCWWLQSVHFSGSDMISVILSERKIVSRNQLSIRHKLNKLAHATMDQ